MKVPFVDITAQNRALAEPLAEAVEQVVSNSQFILGESVRRFEKHFAQYLDVAHCVGMNSGTSALHMALIANDIGFGDEIITTPMTWISTSWAISYVGAKPIFVDIDPSTYTMDVEQVERVITRRTRAILPVHLYGQAANLDRLVEIADRHGLILIEDAAQAHGAKWNGRCVGAWGRLGCFSFYPAKNLGCFGEGGAVVTDDLALSERMIALRDHAQHSRHVHHEIGYNTRMEGLQAAVLDVKLPYLDCWNSQRVRHAKRYHDGLKNLAGITLPIVSQAESHVWHLFVILVEKMSADEFCQKLQERGVAVGRHYPTPIHLQPAYRNLGYPPGSFPTAERVGQTCVSLPMAAELTEDQIDYVIQCVCEVSE